MENLPALVTARSSGLHGYRSGLGGDVPRSHPYYENRKPKNQQEQTKVRQIERDHSTEMGR